MNESGSGVDVRELAHSSDSSIYSPAEPDNCFARTALLLGHGQIAEGFKKFSCGIYADPCHGRVLTRQESEDFSCHNQTLPIAVLPEHRSFDARSK